MSANSARNRYIQGTYLIVDSPWGSTSRFFLLTTPNVRLVPHLSALAFAPSAFWKQAQTASPKSLTLCLALDVVSAQTCALQKPLF
jgi:hypothetical protein